MIYRIVVGLLVFSAFFSSLSAQIGGLATYDFLNLSPSARVTALGGRVVSVFDKDLSVAFSNPALLNDSMHTCVSLSYVNYLKDIGYGTFAYGHRVENIGNFYAGFQTLTFGTFQETDDFGRKLGEYTVGSNALTFGCSRSFGNFHAGTNIRLLQSTVYKTSSWGFSTDFGGLYYNPKRQLGIGMVVRNLGSQFNAYADGSVENLPINLDIGITKKLAKAPFRFSIVGTHLFRPKVIYEDPNAKQQYDLAGNPIAKSNNTVNNIFSHFVFGLEVLISKNFHLRAGYNHQRRNEFAVERSGLNLNGFTMGFGLRIYRFHLDYGYARFHSVGGMHQFGLNVYLNKWKNKNSSVQSNEPQIKTLDPTPTESQPDSPNE